MSERPRRVRVGVLGAGSWARACHLTELAGRPDDVELVAVYDRDPATTRLAVDEFGFALAAGSVEEVVGCDLDLCVVASPPLAHHDQAAAALASGAHVLLEKPMTLSAGDAWSLVDLAATQERELLLAFGWNYNPLFQGARDLLADPGIGELEQVLVHMASATHDLLSGESLDSTGLDGGDARAETWIDPRVAGGGFGQAQLTHALGILFDLWDLDVDGPSVRATSSVGPVPGIELGLAVVARLDGGALLSASGAAFHRGPEQDRQQLEIRAYGTHGQLVLDFERDRVWLTRQDGRDVVVDLGPDIGRYDGRAPVNVLVDLALGRPGRNASSGVVGARTVDVLEAAYADIRRGAVPTSDA